MQTSDVVEPVSDELFAADRGSQATCHESLLSRVPLHESRLANHDSLLEQSLGNDPVHHEHVIHRLADPKIDRQTAKRVGVRFREPLALENSDAGPHRLSETWCFGSFL